MGGVAFRSNDHYLRGRPGEDTARLDWESAPVQLGFGLPAQPVDRTLEENAIPICVTTWEADGVRIQQTAFVSALTGTQAAGPVPAADTLTVFMADFSFTNLTAETPPRQVVHAAYHRGRHGAGLASGRRRLPVGGTAAARSIHGSSVADG